MSRHAMTTLLGLAAFSLSTFTLMAPEGGPTAEFGEGQGLGAFKTPFLGSLKATAAPAADMQKATFANMMGYSGHVTGVHKKDGEAVLLIDSYTGQILPESKHGPDGIPGWATDLGVVMAMLGERALWYAKRVNGQMPEELKAPEVMAFEDLTWLSLNPSDGDETTIDADDEFRMEVLAQVLGINRSEEDGVDTIAGKGLEVYVSSDNTRSEAELAELREAQEERFAATGTGE